LSVNLKPAYEATLEKLLIPIKDRETLFKINYDFKDLERFSQEKVLRGIFLFTQNAVDKESSAHSRSFAPFYGIKEDPVTGSTNCVLAKYLIENNIYHNLNAENGVEDYEYDENSDNKVVHRSQNIVLQTEQGDCLNRKGRIKFEYENDLGKRIKLIASAKLVMKGNLYL
jgi:PhzF family phenazine biosynthesis protein